MTISPEALYDAGLTDLVSVIPPGAQLVPSSTIPQGHVGKVPGRRLGNGLWAGYDWRRTDASREDVRKWTLEGANLGVRAGRFPGIDIDCKDATLAQIIADHTTAMLGRAPVRIGAPPKQLLMYRTDVPFGRMRLWIRRGQESHLVEVLGEGQQYLIYGVHPTTQRPYEWRVTGGMDITTLDDVTDLTPITREQADAFLTSLAESLSMLGLILEREGDGRAPSETAPDQAGLRAPSIDLLRQAVRATPNDNDLFPSRTDYLKMGYAIRAAAGPDDADDGYAIFHEWAAKWTGNDRVAANDPEDIHQDWRRMKGEARVGWGWIAEQARAFGFSVAEHTFDAVETQPEAPPITAPMYSDQWLADKVVERKRDAIRYVPEKQIFLVWDGKRWQPDVGLLAEDLVKRELRITANAIRAHHGVTAKEQKEANDRAVSMCSAAKVPAVASLVKSDRAIAVSMGALDHDPWLLNTPGGMVDLRTGAIAPAVPDTLSTKITAVPPDVTGECPRWLAFLAEATGHDRALMGYLQRLAGYCLTGVTREQHLTFIYGPGGNGKSIFLNVVNGILGDYARVASMDTFTASYGDKHSTDLAMLAGARLVAASETGAGKRWDEARIKSLTGGEPVTARFMRQDNFTYLPQFKLLFVGNHKPEIRDIDDAIRRRIQLVPFVVKPAVVDKELAGRLREEWPAILAWMVRGCLEWQTEGLAPPPSVTEATQEYFAEEDGLGKWISECCDVGPDYASTTQELFTAWREYANRTGEHAGSMKRFASKLSTRFSRWREPANRRMGFAGIRPKPEMNGLDGAMV